MLCTVFRSLKSQNEYLVMPQGGLSAVPQNVLDNFDQASARALDSSKRPVGLPADAELNAAFGKSGFHIFRTETRFDELS